MKWNPGRLKENDLVFVSGHPGKTERMNTVHHLEFLRDTLFPAMLERLYRLEVLASSFGQRSAENARRAQGLLLGVQNSRKARLGNLAGLQDPAIMNIKRREEAAPADGGRGRPETRGRLRRGPKHYRPVAGRLGQARAKTTALLERNQAFNSTLFGIARTLVRLAVETAKPNADRLHEFSDSGLIR